MSIKTFTKFLVDNNLNVETYFDDKISNCKDMDTLPKELTSCKCCNKHKINFPTLGCKLPTSDNKIIHICKCPCRHIARHICREWDYVNEVVDLETSDDESDSEHGEESYNSMDDFIVSDDKTDYIFSKEARKKLNDVLNNYKREKNI